MTGLTIAVDPAARVPLQQQIYDGIRRAILDGRLSPGKRLPSSRALAGELGVSRTTTLLALEQLHAEGYITARPGAGTFVTTELPDELPGSSDTAPRSTPSRRASLSKRGAALATASASAVRVGGPPRAFRIGTPAVDLFPVRLWSRLLGRRAAAATLGQLDYGDVAGFAPLRQAIAAHVSVARATHCTPDHVIVVGGAQRGLEMVCQLLLDPGDEAWLEDPGFPGARSALLSADARIVPVPVDDEGLDVEAGARTAGGAKLVYVSPSHQFPLGVPMTLSRRLALLRWAAHAGAWIVEDDYDAEFRYGARPVPCLHGLDPDARVIYVGSFSKTLFPALRLGFLVVPGDLRDAALAARRSADVHSPSLDQAALADLIGEGHYDRHLRRMRTAYRERLDALVDAAGRYCSGALELRPVRTGLHAVADVIGADACDVFHEATTRGVEVMPASAYAQRPDGVPNALVLGFGAVRAEGIERGMQQLAEAIDAARRSHL